MSDQLLSTLKKLRLSGMAESLEVRLHEAATTGLNHREFLELVAAKLAQTGARVTSAEVALVCARPRLAPFFAAMGEAMSAALATPPGTVTVTATSGDGLGAAGRGEGILASAVVLLEVG